MEIKQVHRKAKKSTVVYTVQRMRKFKDERRVVFTTGSGAVIGEAMMNKADVPLIKEFGKKSRFTNVVVEK